MWPRSKGDEDSLSPGKLLSQCSPISALPDPSMMPPPGYAGLIATIPVL